MNPGIKGFTKAKKLTDRICPQCNTNRVLPTYTYCLECSRERRRTHKTYPVSMEPTREDYALMGKTPPVAKKVTCLKCGEMFLSPDCKNVRICGHCKILRNDYYDPHLEAAPRTRRKMGGAE